MVDEKTPIAAQYSPDASVMLTLVTVDGADDYSKKGDQEEDMEDTQKHMATQSCSSCCWYSPAPPDNRMFKLILYQSTD